MNKKALRSDLLLLLTALIWGFGFVAQRSGMRYVGPFAFNMIRFLLGSVSLIPLILFRKSKGIEDSIDKKNEKNIFGSSFIAGCCLFLAVMIQQFGILFTTAGKAGLITGLYVVLTPIIGNFFGRKTGVFTYIGALLTLVGLYFISAAGKLDAINIGDLITFISAFFWAAHVLLIDRLVQNNDSIRLSAGQFAVCGLLCLPFTFLVEPHISGFIERIKPDLLEQGVFVWKTLPLIAANLKNESLAYIADMLIPLCYGGFAAVGIAYTLQVVAQKDAPPAHATIILCFEGCFAAIGGIVILHEPLGYWTIIGFVCMLAGMLISQWEVVKGKKVNGN
jgi:drug/metabolite transporter (DMT)-like permease